MKEHKKSSQKLKDSKSPFFINMIDDETYNNDDNLIEKILNADNRKQHTKKETIRKIENNKNKNERN